MPGRGSGAPVQNWQALDIPPVQSCVLLPDHHDGGHGTVVTAGGLFSSDGDNALRVWDADTGRLRHLMSGHSDSVTTLVAPPPVTQPNSSTSASATSSSPQATATGVISAGQDGAIRIWDLSQASASGSASDNRVNATLVCADPRGQWVAAGGESVSAEGRYVIDVFDLATGRHRSSLAAHSRRVRALASSPNGAWLASGGVDAAVRLWSMSSASDHRELLGHATWVISLAWSPEGILCSGGDDGEICVWDPASHEPVRRMQHGRDPVLAIAIPDTGAWMASAGGALTSTEACSVQIWNLTTGEPLTRCTGHHGAVEVMVADPRGAWVASAGRDGQVRFWDPSTGGQLGSTAFDRRDQPSLVVLDGGARLAVVGTQAVRFLDAPTGKEIAKIATGGAGRAHGARAGHTKEWLVVAGEEGLVQLCDPDIAQIVAALRVDGPLTGIAAHGDRMVASGRKHSGVFG
jgi:WD40 repeat protein